MANYQIEIKVRIVKREATVPTHPEDGYCTYTLSAEQALSIDACEQALLTVLFPLVRDALAQHFSALSLERAQAMAQSPTEIHSRPYRVDGEVGRFTFPAHFVKRDGQVVYDTASDLFPALGPKEWYRTQGFKELALVFGVVDESFRKTQALLHRVRHQEQGGTPLRTLWDTAEAEGRHLQAYMEQFAATTLEEHGFTAEGAPPPGADYDQQSLVTLPPEQVTAALQACAPSPEQMVEMASNPVPYEDPDHSVLVSMDEVGVKQQRAPRRDASPSPSQPPAPEERKRVHHTVARIAQGSRAYILTGSGVVPVLRLLLAFLLHNQLLRHNLVFFVDGQRSLQAAILHAFAWFAPLQMILDWYHLMEKCQQQLSLALKGREVRNAVLERLRSLLWHGCVTQAVAALQGIPPEQVKEPSALEKLVNYLERNRSFIPCYAVRKRLGLCNSSQAGEKANDLVVAARQKHNGMSWRERGSMALASLTTLVKNGEYSRWFSSRTLAFSFAV
ncbi:MAG: hypothetical protein ACK4WK_00955 [Anaerolineae bacterium]